MRARRVDANHSDIKDAAIKAGLRVYDTSSVGLGFPDLVVQFGDVTVLWEVKNPQQPPSKRRLTPEQQVARDKGLRARTVLTAEDVITARREMVAMATAIENAKRLA